MKTNWYFLLIAIFGMVVLQSCEDDDNNGLKVSEELGEGDDKRMMYISNSMISLKKCRKL